MLDIIKRRNIEFAKMLYEQGRYKEAEMIIKDNLVNAESKYIMGKICAKTDRLGEAEEWLRDSIKNNYKWVPPRVELAKIFIEEGLYAKAEKEYWVCLNREPKNASLKIEAAYLYGLMNEKEEAQKLIDKAVKLNPNDVNILKKALRGYDHLNEYDKMYEICEKLTEKDAVNLNDYKISEIVARTYFKFGKYDKTLSVLSGKTENTMSKIMSNLYKRRIYCILSKDEVQAKMYQVILENLETFYGKEERINHIKRHLKDDKTKEKHGVFTKDLSEVIEKVKSAEKVKQQGKDCDLYCIKLEGCGYEGGNKGDGHRLDYVTLITMPDTYTPITLFPSDKIELKIPKRLKNKEMKKQQEESER